MIRPDVELYDSPHHGDYGHCCWEGCEVYEPDFDKHRQATLDALLDNFGAVDEAIWPYVRRLNLNRNSYTLQSCAGHVGQATDAVESARLWLRLRQLNNFHPIARVLSSRSWCEQVSLIYGRESFPVLEIVWHPHSRTQGAADICELMGAYG